MSDGVGVDTSRPRRIHLVGAGGAGMSAIGTVLLEEGHQVTGSDLKESNALRRLEARGATVWVGHHASHVDGCEIVAFSTAIPTSNPEVRAARDRGITVISRSRLLAALASKRSTIGVAGTHGKTTTCSLLTLALIEAGLDPGYVIGGELNEIGSSAALGSGELFVVEADESDGTFLELQCAAAVVTNIEADHLDHYGSFEGLLAAFEEFAERTQGPVVICADDPVAASLARKCPRSVAYGASTRADFCIDDIEIDRVSTRFTVRGPDGEVGRVSVAVPGLHVALDSTAALVCSLVMGADFEKAVAGIGRFTGVSRRYQSRGVRRGVSFIDDYAHLPGEIAATIGAASAGQFERIVCAFQPHRYSRIGSLAESYGSAFRGADIVVVSDVYPAGERAVPGVTGALVSRAARSGSPDVEVYYEPRISDVVLRLREVLRPGDLCLAMSAGDMVDLGPEVYPE